MNGLGGLSSRTFENLTWKISDLVPVPVLITAESEIDYSNSPATTFTAHTV